MKSKWSDLFGSEWAHVVKLGNCFSDPEEKKSFWETVRDKKLANPKYSIYEDFPTAECATKKAMRECVQHILKLTKPEEKVLTIEPKVSEEAKALSKLFGDLIEIGGHMAEVCPWPRDKSA